MCFNRALLFKKRQDISDSCQYPFREKLIFPVMTSCVNQRNIGIIFIKHVVSEHTFLHQLINPLLILVTSLLLIL